MPVMNKMRDSMPVVFAGLAVIFLLMIIFEWGGQGTLFSGTRENGTLGIVNGYKITQKEYDKTYESVVDQMKSQKKKTELTEAELAQASDDAWNQSVNQALIQQSVQKMGIVVTDQDIRDQLFESPPAFLRPQFTDSLGVFHQDYYVKALRDPHNDSLVRILESDMRQQILNAKWQEAMMTTVRVTDAELHDRYNTDSAKATVQIIKLISSPADATAASKQVTDAEIQKYYETHSWKYKQEETRKFKFAVFQQKVSPKDTIDAMESANTIKKRLEDAAPDEIDTVAKELALDYSEKPYEPAHAINPKEMMSAAFVDAKVGDVVITRAGTQIMVNRIVAMADTGAEMLHMRHILIPFPKMAARDSAKAVADQLRQQVTDANFAQLAHDRSGDPRSAGSGGDMGFVPSAMLPPPLKAAVGNAPTNQVIGPVELNSAFDIIEILGKSRRQVFAVSVPLEIKPSSQSIKMEAQQAVIFHDNAEKNGFDQAAKTSNVQVISDAPAVPKKGQPMFNSHPFVAWLFDASKGDISAPIKMTSFNATVVAQLTDIIPAGPKPLADVKDQIRGDIAKQKAVDAQAARAQQAYAAIGPDGDLMAGARAIGDSVTTLSLGPAESVSGLPSSEYVVNNAAFAMKPGQISKPLHGEGGYYIIKLLSLHVPSEQDFAQVKPQLVRSLLQEKGQRFLQNWIQNMKDNAVITDYRTPN